MRKNIKLSILTSVITASIIFSIVSHNTTVLSNTFSMPENSNADSDYNSYSINNNEKNNINKYHINNDNKNDYIKDRNKNSINNSSNNPINDTDINEQNYSDNNKTAVVKETPISTPAPTSTFVPTSKPKTDIKPKKITKIEFSKHFIKLPVGKSVNISFKTTPKKSLPVKLRYKSLDNSIVKFNNHKITGVKKGFTTILIMLPNKTVKAACPVKIV